MKLTFVNDYEHLSDEEIVRKIITFPYNEEAAAFLIYNRYDPLLFKIYREVYEKDNSWYEDCLSDLFACLKGNECDWNSFRSFEWRSGIGTWLTSIAIHRFAKIKPYLIGKLPHPVSIDEDNDAKAPVVLPDNGIEDYETREIKVLLMEAIGQLKDPNQKFVVLKRLEGFDSKEIAEELRLSWERHGIVHENKGKRVIPTSGYVDVHMQRAKKNLKEILLKMKN